MHIRGYWTRTSAIISTLDHHHHHSNKISSVSSETYPPYSGSTSTPAIPSTSFTPSSTANPTGSSSATTEMPSITSFLTSALTVTSFITLTQSMPQAITDSIEGLPQCAQTIIFPRLADSTCNPANFPCICDELQRLRVREAVATACNPDELAQYDNFAARTCQANRRPENVTTTTTVIVISVNTTTPTPVAISTDADPISTDSALISTGAVPISTGAVPQPQNTTVLYSTAYPISLITSEILIPTTGVNGQPTTITSQIIGPAGPTSTTEPFTGAAAAVVKFGSVRAGMLAGAMGLMGLVFAEL